MTPLLVSGNPQTFHQALLLISSLARLAPDSVLFHVMPVFTFMGSTVFHRDDSYSFKVVQQVRLQLLRGEQYHSWLITCHLSDDWWDCTSYGLLAEGITLSTTWTLSSCQGVPSRIHGCSRAYSSPPTKLVSTSFRSTSACRLNLQ